MRDSNRRRLEGEEPIDEIMAKTLRWSIRESEDYERNLAEWKALRSRAQFCLQCGNEDVDVPELDCADLPHEPCGGTLECRMTVAGGTYRSAYEVFPHKYSIDGELIELGYRIGPW